MTRWTGEACQENSEDNEYFRKLFDTTGRLMTLDGSEDEKIQPQGLDNYIF